MRAFTHLFPTALALALVLTVGAAFGSPPSEASAFRYAYVTALATPSMADASARATRLTLVSDVFGLCSGRAIEDDAELTFASSDAVQRVLARHYNHPGQARLSGVTVRLLATRGAAAAERRGVLAGAAEAMGHFTAAVGFTFGSYAQPSDC